MANITHHEQPLVLPITCPVRVDLNFGHVLMRNITIGSVNDVDVTAFLQDAYEIRVVGVKAEADN